MPNPTWVEVRDKDTGHHFDVPEGDRRIGVSVELVGDGKPRRARNPRDFRPNVPKGETTTARKPAAKES